MDDFEKAILISFDESGAVDPLLKSQAVAYCGQLRDAAILRLCVDRLSVTKFPQVQFWCLQTIHDALRLRYAAIPDADKTHIRKSIMAAACYDSPPPAAPESDRFVRVLDGPVFVKNKLAQVFVALVCFEYPMVWSSLFLDLIGNLSRGPAVIDMFCRILNALDDEVISMEFPRNPDEIAVAGRVKDAMRQQCVNQIVRAWYDIVKMYMNSNSELAALVLETISRYVSWIDIGLIANDAMVPLFFELILVESSPEPLKGPAAACVLAVVSKRMDQATKLSLLQSLQMSRVFGLVAAGDSDSEFVEKLGALITGYASEVLECSKRVTGEEVREVAMRLLEEVLPTVFYVMRNCELDSTFNSIHFLSSYVSTMKSLSPLREKQAMHIGQILEVIRSQILYDVNYRENLSVPDKIGREEEERMSEYRKDFFVLLRAVARVAPDVTQLFIRNSLATATEGNVEDVEAALSLFYAFGEFLSEDNMRSGSGVLGELFPMLLSAKFSCHSYRLVALVYLESIARYAKFALENTQCIPLVLAVFLDDRGIHHPNPSVSQRASYLFMRVVKLLKGQLVPFIETILQSLQDMVARFTSLDWKEPRSSGTEDGSHIFEAIGLLIGMEDVSPEKQADYLSALLSPLCQQVKVELLISEAKMQNSEDSFSKVTNVQQVIMAINALSKGFSERLVTASRPAIGIMFKQTLDVLLQLLIVFPKIEPLRIKVTSFLHRMVDTLGASVFPYLPKALEQLLSECEPKEMAGFLVLINQLICKFNFSVGDILEKIFPAVANRIFHILPIEAIPSGPGTNTEEIRELLELQKAVFTFLHVMATHGLSSIFLAPKCRDYLEQIMKLLLYNSCNHKDILVRKGCVQIFVRLIKDWCDGFNAEEKVPGFRSFIIESFAMNCCFYSVLDKSFEFRDANTLILFGEIVHAQKVLYEKLGDDFLVHFVSRGFTPTHCSQVLVEEYCKKLQGSDMKALKFCYQSIIMELRRQQNGLVFR